MLRIAVCDDDQTIHEDLDKFFLSYSIKNDQDYCAYYFHTAAELLAAPFNYDILFFDIMLDHGIDGIKVGKKLRLMNNRALYILMTSHRDICADGYSLTTFRFLRKPLTQDCVNDVLCDILDHLSSFHEHITISYKHHNYFICIKDINYIESYMRKRYICTTLSQFVTNEVWESLLKQVDRYDGFVRIGKCHLVNMAHIQSYTTNSITMTNGKVLSLSKHAQSTFYKALNKYLRNKR